MFLDNSAIKHLSSSQDGKADGASCCELLFWRARAEKRNVDLVLRVLHAKASDFRKQKMAEVIFLFTSDPIIDYANNTM